MIRFRPIALAVLLAIGAPATAQSVSSAITYQGELRASGQPANAAYDFQFRLYNSPSGTTQLGAQVSANAVTVSNGLFSVPLDFGPAQFAGDAQWLEISVRPTGSGAFETLSPRTAVTATPYALGAVAALANSVTTTSVVDGTLQFSDVNAAQFQARVSGTCSGSQGIQSIAANGTVVCGTFGGGGGSITGVVAGTGLAGGGTSGSVTLGIAAGGVGSAQVNPAQVQLRVAGTCPAGQFMRQVLQTGNVECSSDSTGSDWSLAGNAGINPLAQFIGTTDNQPLVVRANGLESARFTPDGVRIGGDTWDPAAELTVRSNGLAPFANILLEPTVVSGTRSGILLSAGGGTIDGNDRGFFIDQYSNAGGAGSQLRRLALDGVGRGRFAGTDVQATAANAVAIGGVDGRASGGGAVMAGGRGSVASGQEAAALAGLNNTASGFRSATLGGAGNCAGGDNSLALGTLAKVRVGTGVGEPGLACDGVPSSGTLVGDNGTFVWADSQVGNFVSSGPNQFNIRAAGGVNLHTSTNLTFGSQTRQMINLWGPRDYGIGVQSDTQYFRSNANFGWFQAGSHVDGALNPGTGGALLMSLTTIPISTNPFGFARAQSFVNVSDRAAKDGFSAIDPLDVLGKVVAMPMSRWFYRNAPDQWHIGPVAQDFFAAFKLGGEDKTISTVDADGVALAAIQGLNAKLEAERDALAAEVAQLQQDNEALRSRMDAIEARLGGGR